MVLLLDAVSSFGGESLDFEGWNIEACASSANQCLHGVPGVSFAVVRKAALEWRRSGACSVYLDLFRHYEEQRQGYALCTPAVPALYALQEVLRELEEGGRLGAAPFPLPNLIRHGSRRPAEAWFPAVVGCARLLRGDTHFLPAAGRVCAFTTCTGV